MGISNSFQFFLAETTRNTLPPSFANTANLIYELESTWTAPWNYAKLHHPPCLEITCKWNKNCTGKIMVPLKFLRKRSSRFGATCWGITTPQANRADGLCKYCKGLPHPPAHASLWVVIPQHVAPNLELLFPNYFSGTYGISVQFFFDWSIFSNGVRGLSRKIVKSDHTCRRVLATILPATTSPLFMSFSS